MMTTIANSTLIFYDVEVFKYDWLVVFNKNGELEVIVNDSSRLLYYMNSNQNSYFVGYNNYNYDDYIITSILNGNSDLYSLSKQLIDKKIKPKINIKFKSLDLMQDIRGYISLKKIMGNLGMNIKETPVSFDINRKLTSDELNQVIKYCKNDVHATKEIYKYRLNYFKTKFTLIKKFNLPEDYIRLSENQLSYKILDCNYFNEPRDYLVLDYVKGINWNLIPDDVSNFFENLEQLYRFGKSYEDICKIVKKHPLQIVIAHTNMTYGIGGLHGFSPISTSIGNTMCIDVSSYYPSLIVNNNFNSRAITKPYIYEEMYYDRLKLKNIDEDLSSAYKLVLNKVSGCMRGNTKLSDYRNGNRLVINGQLILTQLVIELQDYIVLLQVNTDGIIFNYRKRDYDSIMNIVRKFEEKFSLGFKCDNILYFYQRNISNYIMIKKDGTVKCKGELFKNYNNKDEIYLSNSLSIVPKALGEYYLHNTPIEDTVKKCYDDNELDRFQLIVSYKSSYDRCVVEVNGELVKQQKVNRVFATTDTRYGKMFKVKFDKNGKEQFEKVQDSFNHNLVFNKSIKKLDKKMLDLDYYINLCKKKLEG